MTNYDRRNKQYKKKRDRSKRNKDKGGDGNGDGQGQGGENGEWKDMRRPATNYDEIPKENAMMEAYYKAQGNIPEAEWDSFMDAMRRPLPTTFRFAGSRSHALDVRDAMIKNYLPTIAALPSSDVEGESVVPPAPFPWYPNELAWNLYVSRTMLRKSPELAAFHQFLVSETEAGNISRQEAVSMIPPLLLDVQPGHWVLDMCAAPGSKTAQLAEFLEDRETSISSGLLVGNDADYKRAQIMIRQVKRVNTPCLLVTNHEAQQFPGIPVKLPDGKTEPITFDRILADVPCSGDGTLRKNIPIWKNWTSHDGNSLHGLQLRILLRAAQLARPGGLIVYSTCSMNPVENEAVVAEALRKSEVQLELVDVSDKLPGLKRRSGMLDWKVADKTGEFYETVEATPEDSVLRKFASLWPKPDLAKLNIDRCVRVVPHDQDTGAFFIAVLRVGEKRAEESTTAAETEQPAAEKAAEDESHNDSMPGSKRPATDAEGNSAAKRVKEEKIPGLYDRKWGEDPFIYLEEDDECLREIKDIYGISEGFPFKQTLSRSAGARHKTVYFTSNAVKSVLQSKDVHRLKVVNAGLKLFIRNDSDKNALTPFRLHSEALPYLFPYLSDKRLLTDVPLKDIFVLLQQEYPKLEAFTEGTAARLSGMGQGCVVIRPRDNGQDGSFPLKEIPTLTTWMARVSCNLLLNRADRQSLLIRLGVMPNTEEAQKKRVEKAQAAAALAAGHGAAAGGAAGAPLQEEADGVAAEDSGSEDGEGAAAEEEDM